MLFAGLYGMRGWKRVLLFRPSVLRGQLLHGRRVLSE
jgi:hypothetical protein